jgi:cytochrome c oxidase subunit II
MRRREKRHERSACSHCGATPVIERLLPIAGSEHAADLDAVLMWVHVHVAIQAVAWGAFFIYCLVRFRRGAHPRASHAGIRPLVPALAIALVIAGDAVLLAAAALPAWFKYATVPAADFTPLEIRVVAEQFAWNIHYPGPDRKFGATTASLIHAANPLGIDRADANARDDIGLLNVLTVPLGRPIIVHLTSRDVVHSFTLNEMRVRQDATPGLVVRTWFTPTVIGRWEIACSQLCGLGHYRMRGEFAVLSAEEWEAWMRSEQRLLR